MAPVEVTLRVSPERAAELILAIEMVAPTTQHPLPHERILVLGLQAIRRQHKRRKYQRTWYASKKEAR